MEDVKKILEGYRWANIEAERMEKRRRRLEKKMGELAVDTVRGSMEEYPFIERVVKIEGKQGALLTELQYQIDQKIEEGLKARKAAEDIIALAEDPREREILRSRFVDCKSWEEVGKTHYIDKRQAQRVVQRFREKMEKK